MSTYGFSVKFVPNKSSIFDEDNGKTFLGLDEGQFRFVMTLDSHPYIRAFSSHLDIDAVQAMYCFETMLRSAKKKKEKVYDNNDDNILEFPSVSKSQLPKSIWNKYANILRPLIKKDYSR